MAKKERPEFQPHVQIMLNIFEVADLCRRENDALRSILRKQGLSDPAIRSRVRRILKKPDLDETGAQLLKRVSEESLQRFARAGRHRVELADKTDIEFATPAAPDLIRSSRAGRHRVFRQASLFEMILLDELRERRAGMHFLFSQDQDVAEAAQIEVISRRR